MYPFYLGSLRSIIPDFISRESKHDIDCWAETAGYTQAEKPRRWTSFAECAPKLDWLEDRIVHLPRHLSFDTICRLGEVAERKPFSGIAMRIFDELNLDYHSVGGLDLFQYYRCGSVSGWKLILDQIGI